MLKNQSSRSAWKWLGRGMKNEFGGSRTKTEHLILHIYVKYTGSEDLSQTQISTKLDKASEFSYFEHFD